MGGSLLICTDLDRTLIPNGAQPESPGAREMLGRLVARPEVTLTFVTGRDRQLVEQAIRDFSLPTPDFVIGDVGTTLYRVGREHVWQPDANWTDTIDRDWGGRSSADLAAMLGELSDMWLQPEDRQNRHKLSYFTDANLDVDAAEAIILQRLAQSGVRARVVWSVEEGSGETEPGGLLDVLPASASKFHAIHDLMVSRGFRLEQTVFSGDSGNDLEVLASPLQAVLVANASDAVRQKAIRLAKEAGHSGMLYLARGGFAGMNGNYAAGILEGIAHYIPRAVEWMASGQEGNAGK